MKKLFYLLTILSLISLISSACENTEVKIGVDANNADICVTKIEDCTEYGTPTGKAAPCTTCGNSKVPDTNGAACEACDNGEETKDGKKCHPVIADCAEYDDNDLCVKCTGKIPKSDKTACEACPEGKETKDGKTCVDKTSDNSSISSFIKMSIFALLCLFSMF